MDEAELAELGRRTAAMIIRGLGSRSRWALKVALDAAEVDGITGILVLQIPPKTKDHVDVTFTAGQADLITRWTA